MKKILFPLFLFIYGFVSAQDSTAVVKWDFTASKGGVLVLHGTIKPGWRLYSTTMKDDLPNTRVAFDSSTKAKIASVEEKGKAITEKEALFDNAETRSFSDDVQLLVSTSGVAAGAGDIKGTVTYMAIYKDSVVGPVEVPFRYGVGAGGELAVKAAGLQESTAGSNDLHKSSIDLAHPVNGCGGTGTEGSESKGMLGIFILGFLGGLVGLIMPCTFPMIPLTVSFFTKRAKSRKKGIQNAFLYGFFIFLIYVLISVPFYFLKGSDANILNNISTNVWLNIFFGVVFIIFAISFFGAFEITLPSSISNSVDSKSNIGSVGGIFFMALTLAIVSFSCTGPILGTLLFGAVSQAGGAFQLTVALAGFGLALGLPFALFALFPGWLQSLPRSGDWMNTVKKVFAFVELALALKYISNADLVSNWGLLKRETFFILWILISAGLAIYFFMEARKKHSKTLALLGLPVVAFTVYLCFGLAGKNLSLISGFPPPMLYSWHGKHVDEKEGLEANVINDYDQALALARKEHKPVLIDFTGWACVNCRRMEENVWTQPEVKDLIKKDYILVSLYVDDRKRLPEDVQFSFTTKDGSKKAIKTVGDKYATLQSENFENVSQPLYVVISPDEKLMTKPVGFTPSVKEYASWLECGLAAFKKQ